MAAKALYTAIGRLETRRDGDGDCPIIRLGGKEYGMDVQELAVWTSLAWRIVRREEIGLLYGRMCQGIALHASRTWAQCADRLVTRGLLVAGTGDTEYDALYDLLSALYIIPTSGTLPLRLFTFLKLTLLGRVPFSAARCLFRKDDRTEGEAHVMRLAEQALLSTAEIIQCVEKGVFDLPTPEVSTEQIVARVSTANCSVRLHKNTRQYTKYCLRFLFCLTKNLLAAPHTPLYSALTESVMDAVYDDRDATCDNLPFTARSLSGSQQVTLDVANLYLRKQIVFERV